MAVLEALAFADSGAQVVLTRDQHDPTGPLVRRRITRTYQRTAHSLQILTVRDETGVEQTLKVTEEHPFYRESDGWTPAKSLEAGDMLLGADGTLTVVANEHEAHPNGVTVYNLEVEQAHTYFVLAEDAHDAAAVWVHNAEGYSFANRGNGGRGGGSSHARVQDDIYRVAGGNQEVPILGSGGRIADNIDAMGRVHQIGDMRWRSGFRPSDRERAAIEDIRKAVGPDTDIIFHDKRGRLPSLINPDMQPTWRPASLKFRKNV